MKRHLLLFVAVCPVLLSTTGCFEATKSTRKVQPVYGLVIPADCIDQVRGTQISECRPIDGHPDWADCKNVVVHMKCTKVAKRE
jgi:hypothetical protein